MPRDGGNGSALAKALTVLETVIGHSGPVSVGAIGMWLGLPKQTVHRIVRQLVDEGLLRRAPDGDGYAIAPRLRALAHGTLARSLGDAPMRAILQGLVDELGETCNLGILDNHEVLYMERVECDWPLRMQLQPGSRVPAHCTGIGKMLLAMLDARARKRLVNVLPLTGFTERTITDADALLAQLKVIRRQGHALNDQENTLGMMGLAVPVRDGGGRTIAALAVHAPVARLAPAAALARLPILREAAAALTAAMPIDDAGARPPEC